MRPFLLCSFAIWVGTHGANAQSNFGGESIPFFRWDGSSNLDKLGTVVHNAGDVNGDGVDDIVTGSPTATVGGIASAGSVMVISGLDGTILHQWNGTSLQDSIGQSCSGAGDVNADGFQDIVFGNYSLAPGGLTQAGAAYVYSGADGTLLHQWIGSHQHGQFGYSVSFAGDMNQDGFDDILVGQPHAFSSIVPNPGKVFAFSGADGSLLMQWDGNADGDNFGIQVASCGDITGDGKPEILVSAQAADPSGLTDAGSVSLFSGADGTLVYQWDGTQSGERIGASAQDIGDMDADGFPDIAFGSAYSPPFGNIRIGATYAFSGATGNLLYRWLGKDAYDLFGVSLAGAGDLNRDGFQDLLIGSPQNASGPLRGPGMVQLFSGKDGTLVRTWTGEERGDNYSRVTAIDFDSDGRNEIVIGARGANPGILQSAGSIYAFGFQPALFINQVTVSASLGGNVQLDLDFPQETALQPFKTLFSSAGTGPMPLGVPIPLSLDSLFSASFMGNYPFSSSNNLHGTLDLFGQANASFDVAPGAAAPFLGHTFFVAAVAFSAGQTPAFSSAAVALKIIP